MQESYRDMINKKPSKEKKKEKTNEEFLWEVSNDIYGSNTKKPAPSIKLDTYIDSC